MVQTAMREVLATGLPSKQVADAVLDAIREEKFYILTHPEANVLIEARMQDILQGRLPTYQQVL
jgi:hypothetical protein